MPVHVVGPPSGVRGDRADARRLARGARRVLRALGHARSELSLALVDDAQIQELNAQYRKKNQPTDVLSFSLIEGPHGNFRGAMLGDVIISVETAARQAAARHRGLDDELVRLVVHGILHLLGHDHEEDGEARIMEREERRMRRMVRASEASSI